MFDVDDHADPLPYSGNQWILDNFANAPIYSGEFEGITDILYPALVADAISQGGTYGFSIVGGDPPDYDNQSIAFVNVTIRDQIADGKYGASIITHNYFDGANGDLNVYMSNVLIEPNWPEWQDYDTTNWDGITLDAGWNSGNAYLEDVTIRNWAEAAVDLKAVSLEAVRLLTEGDGLNTLKLWQPGPHYIVDSVINNDRYLNNQEPPGSDGGLIWTWDCSALVINVYNSTFNGEPTIPWNCISCEIPGEPTINYLTYDPRTTGEMHPMFVAS